MVEQEKSGYMKTEGGRQKKMYVPEFWCGVAATLIVETLALIAAMIHFGRKKQKLEADAIELEKRSNR